jgi:hypothetical protein
MDSGNDCGIVLRHALAHGDELRRRILVNKQQPKYVAKLLGLPFPQVAGVARLLKSLDYHPSRERLALVAMNDFGMEDADIAEMFSETPDWAAAVRADADGLRQREPMRRELEYVDEGLRPQDPCPEELYRRAAEIRSRRDRNWSHSERGRPVSAPAQGGMRHDLWDGRNASYVSISAQRWAGR